MSRKLFNPDHRFTASIRVSDFHEMFRVDCCPYKDASLHHRLLSLHCASRLRRRPAQEDRGVTSSPRGEDLCRRAAAQAGWDVER